MLLLRLLLKLLLNLMNLLKLINWLNLLKLRKLLLWLHHGEMAHEVRMIERGYESRRE